MLALGAWYLLGYARQPYAGRTERQEARRELEMEEKTPLEQRIMQMLTEARVILPGAQALFGFQLAIVLTQAFDKLPAASKGVHAASLGCLALCIICLMAPAAYHRIVFAGEDTEEMHRCGSRFVAGATVPLAFGLAGDAYVVIAKIAGSPAIGVAAAAIVLALLVGLWHAFPLLMRASHEARRRHGAGRGEYAR